MTKAIVCLREAKVEKVSDYPDDPHSARRREILQRHPEIKRLMGYDPSIAFIVTAQVFAQIFLCWLVKDASWTLVLVISYCLGTFINQSLAVAVHEMGHNLAFGHKQGWRNRALSIWSNLPLVVPLAITFRRYHADHHRYLGDKVIDTDVPLPFEVSFFHHPLTKVLWMILHPLIYAVRPFFKNPRPLCRWELVNLACQLAFNYVIYVHLGAKALVYLASGLAFGLSLHPLAAHYISEHYFLKGGQPTHSYYGPLNRVLFNAGYHNEHHDFPYVPYRRLPEIRRLAPEYYDSLPHHCSYVKVMWNFIWERQTAPGARGLGYDKPL